MAISLLSQVDADLVGRGERHNRANALFSDLRMAEQHLVRSGRHRYVAERRLAALLSVDPDLRPWRGAERHRPLRLLRFDWRDTARRDVDALSLAVTDPLVDEQQLVAADRDHDAVALARTEQAPSFEDLEWRRSIDRNPSRNGRVLRCTHWDDERGGG